ncbi:MAG: histidine kinase dimerization/phospho-acceptor domain-containing protein [Candidatus Omnitrophota bacterium]
MLNLILDPKNYFFNPYALPYYWVGTLTLGEGIFILVQNRRSLVNISYIISCLAVALWLIGVGMIYSSSIPDVAHFWARTMSFLGIIFITPSIYFFSVCWQSPLLSRPQTKRKYVYVAVNLALAVILYISCINSNLLVKGMWQYPWGFYPRAGNLYFVFLIWFYYLMILSIKNFLFVYKQEEIPIKKKQALLIIAAFSIAFIGSVEFLPNFGISLYLLAFMPVFVCITIVGYSIVKYKLMDIETVFHKTIAWLFTNIALVMPFLLLIYLTRNWYSNIDNPATYLYLAAISFLFLLFVRIVQPRVDHFFQKRRAGMDKTLNKFSEDLVYLKGFSQLIVRIEEEIANTLYPQNIEIFILNESKNIYELAGTRNKSSGINSLEVKNEFLLWLTKNNRIVNREFIEIDPVYIPIKDAAKDYFYRTETGVVIPLVLNDKLLGAINLEKKANLQRYTSMDFYFLNVLKNQSTIAVANSLLYKNIEEQVRQRTQELVEVQKQLVHAEKLATVGTLAGGVAHEINNPLTAILTNVQMLLSGDELDKESLEMIEEATKRCKTIVQKLMTFSKKPMESTMMYEINLLEIIRNTVDFLKYQLEQENISLKVTAGKESYPVIANHDELGQVVTNIILNARDAIKQIKKKRHSFYNRFRRRKLG